MIRILGKSRPKLGLESKLSLKEEVEEEEADGEDGGFNMVPSAREILVFFSLSESSLSLREKKKKNFSEEEKKKCTVVL